MLSLLTDRRRWEEAASNGIKGVRQHYTWQAHAADYMVKLYPDGAREEKTAVIHSMMIMENTEGLLSLLKQESDPELQREMLQMLATMDSEETDEYLFELLEKNG